MGSTSGIILIKFRYLSKIITKMNWSKVLDTLIGKKEKCKDDIYLQA